METLLIEQSDRENVDVSLRMRGQVLSEMDHFYLTNRLGLPVLEQFQLQTVTAILETSTCPKEDAELITTVLLLIYHGLSVHEHIDDNVTDEKCRQLKVLAGDYYSSKYFHLLAKSGDIELVGIFAEAVARINEAKAERISLFQSVKSSADKYMHLSERIYGELLFAICNRYHRTQPIISDIVRMLVRTYVLGTEYAQFVSGHYFENLSHMYIKGRASEEELRYFSPNYTYLQESKLMTTHVKYGTSSYLFEQLQTGFFTTKSLVSVLDSAGAAKSFDDLCSYLDQTCLETNQLSKKGEVYGSL